MNVSDIRVGAKFVSVAGEYRVTSVQHVPGQVDVKLQPINGGSTVSTTVVSTKYGRWIA